jgi:hypothetical protein
VPESRVYETLPQSPNCSHERSYTTRQMSSPRKTRWCSAATLAVLAAVVAGTAGFASTALAQAPQGGESIRSNMAEPDLHKLARSGDVALLTAQLRLGANANVRDAGGRTPLMDAVAAGKLGAVRALLAAGADVNARAKNGITALMEAADKGRTQSAALLMHAGADLNAVSRGWGTALETADRNGHPAIARMLRDAGARTSGRSVGDTVCVRPWHGEGYCGTVVRIDRTQYQLHVNQIVGCVGGCAAKGECSAGRRVSGSDGIKAGDGVTVPVWCLTHTGVKP